jgi:hypothetical protein
MHFIGWLPLLDGIQPNEQCDCRLIVGAKEESFDSGNDEQEIPSRWDKS